MQVCVCVCVRARARRCVRAGGGGVRGGVDQLFHRVSMQPNGLTSFGLVLLQLPGQLVVVAWDKALFVLQGSLRSLEHLEILTHFVHPSLGQRHAEHEEFVTSLFMLAWDNPSTRHFWA